MLPEKTQAQHVKMHHHLVSGRALATQHKSDRRGKHLSGTFQKAMFTFSPQISVIQ